MKDFRRLSLRLLTGTLALMVVCLGAVLREGWGQNHTTVAIQKIDINTATRDELRELPGIGETLADKIIRNRPYKKLDDLVSRKILGRKQMARIKAYVRVSTDDSNGGVGATP